MTFYRNKISLSTVNGRVECEYKLPADSLTPYEEYVLSEDYELRASTLQYNQATDEFYFHITTRTFDGDGDEQENAEVSADTEHQTVLGIDLGVNSFAVASTGTFWVVISTTTGVESSRSVGWICNSAGHRSRTTPCSGSGSVSEHGANRYIHTVANEIVTEAVEHGCDVIVFEDLTNIRERLPHVEWHHLLAFRRLVEYVEYKAPERGVAVKQVDLGHTSQRCSYMGCGFTHEGNRDGEQFRYLNCGYEINADYNDAKNVGLRYLRKRQHRLRSSPTSGSADAPVDVRINGGTLNGDGFRPCIES